MNWALNALAVVNFVWVFLFTIPGLVYFGFLNFLGFCIRSESLRHYSHRCMLGPDQWWNAALRGEEDETVSSRLGRALKSGKPKAWARAFALFVDLIFLLAKGQKSHCLQSIELHCFQTESDERWNFIKIESETQSHE